jgi:dTMP kinase
MGDKIASISHIIALHLSFSYGGERYEKKEMQIRVRHRFGDLEAIDKASGRVAWKFIDAAQSVEQVENDIWKAVEETIQAVKGSKALGKMWQDGEYEFKSVGDGESESP